MPLMAAAAISVHDQLIGWKISTTIPNSSVVSTMPICLLAVVPPTFCMTMP